MNASTTEPGPHAARVMVVDDLAEHADALTEYLGRKGVEARPAYEASDAIVLAETWLPDAAILGMPLANGAGFPLARHLRESLGPELKLVAVSRWTAAPDRERMAHAGFDEVLPRSATPEQLYAAVSSETARLIQALVRSRVRRCEILVSLCYSLLDFPTRDAERRVRASWNVRRLVEILHRDCPHLPAGEPRDRIAARIAALERAIEERAKA